MRCFPFHSRHETVVIVGIHNMSLVDMPKFTPLLPQLLEWSGMAFIGKTRTEVSAPVEDDLESGWEFV